MANEKNLITQAERSKEQAKAISRMGGLARGKQRKARRTFKEIAEQMLQLKTPEDIKNKLINKFPELKNLDLKNSDAITLAQLARAISGDTKAFEVIRDTVGDRPVNVNVDVTTDDPEFRNKFFNID